MVVMVTKFTLMLEGIPYEVERRGEMLLVNGHEYPAEIKGTQVTVAGNPHTVEVASGGKSAKVDGIGYPIETQGLEEPSPKKIRKAASQAAGEEAGAITAIMPGLIVRVLKKEGDRVEAGDVVIVLEAMKMQNELHAKKAGVVHELHVKVGDTVEMRQVLAVIE